MDHSKLSDHHKHAAAHHEKAAHHHHEAAKHHEKGDHEKAAHHAHVAHGHHLQAEHHHEAAAKHHAEHHWAWFRFAIIYKSFAPQQSFCFCGIWIALEKLNIANIIFVLFLIELIIQIK